jgi:hypothetical protein
MKLIATLMMTTIFTSQALSADMIEESTPDYCVTASTSNLLMMDDNGQLTSEIVRLMDQAILVVKSDEAINLSRPVYIWAMETKAACGKAYGYMQTNYRDEDYINKCECFHSRMVEYMR